MLWRPDVRVWWRCLEGEGMSIPIRWIQMAKLPYHTLLSLCGSRKVFYSYFGHARIPASINRMNIVVHLHHFFYRRGYGFGRVTPLVKWWPRLVEDGGWTPQSFAPGSEEKGVIELLLLYQHAHPYSGEKEGWTPLWCATRGSRECDEYTSKLPRCWSLLIR